MLILSRKSNESVIIDGRIIVKIMRVDGDIVKLGIEAPSDIPIFRQEIYEEIHRNNREAMTQGRPSIPRLRRQPSTKQNSAEPKLASTTVQLDMEVTQKKHTQKGQ
ncbi:MAG: carbon storage regulator CsrA [Verrucomicrobiales bacterium]|nr:carbon storage regulator CsrA [Verrucomicrobiales bacterium]